MNMLNAREAGRKAKQHIAELLSDENITEIGLEEIEYEDDQSVWLVTVGFFRPWHKGVEERNILGEPRLSRSYKVVRLDAAGEVLSVRHRDPSIVR